MNERLWNKHYISVLLVNTLNAFSFYMTATILSKYLVNIGTTVAIAGFIVGLFSLTSLCCRPFSGIMADRLSNVTLLKWSNVLMGIGLLGFTLTTQIPLLVGFRIINGIRNLPDFSGLPLYSQDQNGGRDRLSGTGHGGRLRSGSGNRNYDSGYCWNESNIFGFRNIDRHSVCHLMLFP